MIPTDNANTATCSFFISRPLAPSKPMDKTPSLIKLRSKEQICRRRPLVCSHNNQVGNQPRSRSSYFLRNLTCAANVTSMEVQNCSEWYTCGDLGSPDQAARRSPCITSLTIVVGLGFAFGSSVAAREQRKLGNFRGVVLKWRFEQLTYVGSMDRLMKFKIRPYGRHPKRQWTIQRAIDPGRSGKRDQGTDGQVRSAQFGRYPTRFRKR